MEIINKQSLSFLCEKDVVFQRILTLYGSPPSWSRPEGFETLCRIILEQQVSLESGKASYEKLSGLVPKFIPEEIVKLDELKMRKATVSRQKASYLLGLAHSILNCTIDLTLLNSDNVEDSTKILTAIRGIGPWTAEVYLLFSLQAQDIYPRGDIALINTIKELWFVEDASSALTKSTSWAPYRSAASFLLWHYYLSKRNRVSPI